MLSHGEMREIFQNTVVVRKPTYGIVSGYHELPYICLGQSFQRTGATMEVRGKVHVSPRFVIRPDYMDARYKDIFGEENIDAAISGRVFGYLGFRRRPVECKSEYLELRHRDDQTLAGVLDELDRMEDITTGVIITPDSRYYPVSLERFLASILDDEFAE